MNRRNFLKLSGSGVAALAVVRWAPEPEGADGDTVFQLLNGDEVIASTSIPYRMERGSGESRMITLCDDWSYTAREAFVFDGYRTWWPDPWREWAECVGAELPRWCVKRVAPKTLCYGDTLTIEFPSSGLLVLEV